MSSKTILVLVAALVGLGVLAWLQLRQEAADLGAQEVELFPGVERARVRALRIEDVQRGTWTRLERGASGGWTMTDPERVPAEAALADLLLTALVGRKATSVPEREADARALGFEPPRALVEIEEEVGGELRRHRLELGALDADEQRVHVRAGGRFLRTWRDLDTNLVRPHEDFRATRILELDPRTLVEWHRRGRFTLADGEQVEADLDALADGGAWRATAPAAGLLDAGHMALLTHGLAQLRALEYVDFGQAPLARFGLDPPEATLEVVELSGARTKLRFGRPGAAPGGAWTCAVEGRPFVYAFDPDALGLLTAGLEELLDRRFTRVPRAAVEGLVLEHGGRVIEAVHTLQKRDWRVRASEQGAWGEWAEAEATRVEELLSQLDRLEFARFDPARSLAEADVRARVHLVVAGERVGGVLGEPFDVEGGGRAVLFRRDGDERAAVCDAGLAVLAATPIEQLVSLSIASITEVIQRALTLEDGVTRREYERSSKGQWVPKGLTEEARELREVLDLLLFPRAERHLSAGERVELVRSITVSFVNPDEVRTSYVVALGGPGAFEGRQFFQCDGRVSLAADGRLHERLSALLAPR